MRTWKEADEQQLREFTAQGLGPREIARRMGRTKDAVSQKLTRLRSSQSGFVPTAPVTPSEAVESFRQSALDRTPATLARAPVTGGAQPEDTGRVWVEAEAKNAKAIAHASEKRSFEADFRSAGLIGISFVSDQHITEGQAVDLKRMREDAELIRDTPGMYCCLAGDAIDNHIFIRRAMLAARTQPSDQWRLFEWYLNIIAPKVLVVVAGNHDLWTDSAAGVDMLAVICSAKQVCYAPFEARLDVNLGSQKYRVAVRHKARFNSSFNQTHAHKQWWRMGPADWDVGVLAHLHEPAMEPFHAHSKLRWAIRPGSYQISTAWSMECGFNDAIPTCPTVLLYGDHREIVGMHDLRVACRFLRSERIEMRRAS